jgi:hypothetical protein
MLADAFQYIWSVDSIVYNLTAHRLLSAAVGRQPVCNCLYALRVLFSQEQHAVLTQRITHKT